MPHGARGAGRVDVGRVEALEALDPLSLLKPSSGSLVPGSRGFADAVLPPTARRMAAAEGSMPWVGPRRHALAIGPREAKSLPCCCDAFEEVDGRVVEEFDEQDDVDDGGEVGAAGFRFQEKDAAEDQGLKEEEGAEEADDGRGRC